MGNKDTAYGDGSTAMGNGCVANITGSTAIGQGCRAIGNASTALGASKANGGFSVAIGGNNIANGGYSTAIGYSNIANGNSSMVLGTLAEADSAHEGSFVFADHSVSLNTQRVKSSAANQMTMRFAGGYRFFTNSATSIGTQIAAGGNSWTTISDSTKKTNFKKPDGEYFLSSLSKLKLGSWNYKVQDAKNFRHYGPMAQEMYRYFGNDGIGTIGNDTTISSADIDGIMMICLQTLEKRTGELQKANQKIAELEKKATELAAEQKKVSQLQSSFDEMKKEMLKMKIELQDLAAAKSVDSKSKVAFTVNNSGE